MNTSNAILSILVLIVSVIAHEVAHGIAAEKQGDPTPRAMGRITLNPIKHLDFMGSIVVPIMLIVVSSPIVFGWAKPVPFNPGYFRNKRWGDAIVAVAGPATNIILAAVFSILAHLLFPIMPDAAVTIVTMIIVINVSLALFNLMPVPPLDGHHILKAILGAKSKLGKIIGSHQPFIVSLIVVLVLWQFVAPLVLVAARALIPGV
jgi:Zn-dependent protease